MIVLLDWSGTISNFPKNDLLLGKDVVNKKLVPFLGCNRIGIVSNTSKDHKALTKAVNRQFSSLGLRCEVQVYNTMFKNKTLFKKPSPCMIWYALQKMNVSDHKEVIFIGDKESDRKAALTAGIGFMHIDTLLKLI